jgi:hypothetical protein
VRIVNFAVINGDIEVSAVSEIKGRPITLELDGDVVILSVLYEYAIP